MLGIVSKKWSENKDRLEHIIRNKDVINSSWEYIDFLILTLKTVIGDDHIDCSRQRITVVDNGYMSGTLMFLIPKNDIQPMRNEYFLTCVDYGTISSSDVLKKIQDRYAKRLYYKDIEEGLVQDVMMLCLNLLQNMVMPYGDEIDTEEKSVAEELCEKIELMEVEIADLKFDNENLEKRLKGV